MDSQLETLIDAHGLPAVLESLSRICDEKADHIRASYSDDALAQCWTNSGAVIARAETRIREYGL